MTRDGSESGGLSVRLARDLISEIERASERTGKTLSEVIEQALRFFLLDRRNVNSIYLSAPVNAMMKGLYEQDMTMGELKKHGNFGLGTFNGLDGEMAMLDGKIYQLKDDSYTYDVPDSARTPFACVTFFAPETTDEIEEEMDYGAFFALLDRLLPSRNMLYAIRVEAFFREVKVWSVRKQENHAPVPDESGAQPSFELRDVEGTLAGFYTPSFIRMLNMPGYHLHFLTSGRDRGGHLKECRVTGARIDIQHVARLKMDLPMTLDYLTSNLSR
ncbi:MAG: acetolactate decarboxylase [Syntrophales bacterium]|nr:acetolactate decarboxylase [Syntrophales bacterium]MDD5234264.1 acetolactate decarboxylase [Syntrophales bacterium]MDD5531802.1 acetolactate decarboxylase [Syntrophales bacterium]